MLDLLITSWLLITAALLLLLVVVIAAQLLVARARRAVRRLRTAPSGRAPQAFPVHDALR